MSVDYTFLNNLNLDMVNNYFPNWVLNSLDSYSNDYPHLQSNWEKICNMLKTTPKKILLVSNINFEKSILNIVSEVLTKNGYCIRRIDEFIACVNCEKAIPCKEIWELLKEKGFNVPNVWKIHCKNCV